MNAQSLESNIKPSGLSQLTQTFGGGGGGGGGFGGGQLGCGGGGQNSYGGGGGYGGGAQHGGSWGHEAREVHSLIETAAKGATAAII